MKKINTLKQGRSKILINNFINLLICTDTIAILINKISSFGFISALEGITSQNELDFKSAGPNEPDFKALA
ncbi:unnamed protein product [Rhizophagus irregularis]|nr:unnamed protein product [Rhizophagus irregularis]